MHRCNPLEASLSGMTHSPQSETEEKFNRIGLTSITNAKFYFIPPIAVYDELSNSTMTTTLKSAYPL